MSQSLEGIAFQAKERERAKALSLRVPRVFQEQPHFEFKICFKQDAKRHPSLTTEMEDLAAGNSFPPL